MITYEGGELDSLSESGDLVLHPPRLYTEVTTADIVVQLSSVLALVHITM